jgi:predicted small metal-binding protein
MPETMDVRCPSCGKRLEAADEDGLVNVLQEHLHEKHALEMPRERVRENVAAQLKDFDGYNARPISGA